MTPHDPAPAAPLRSYAKRAFTAGLAAMVALLIGWLAQSEIVLITGEHNGEFPSSSYALREDDSEHPRLQLLRSREHLDDVVAPADTQFEAIVLLRAWAHRQWTEGGEFRYPPWDAVEILDLARKHGNKGFCAQYAIVFLQACQALGLHARYVDLPGHFVVAVWSDDYDRWVVMDPSKDLSYEKDGLPARGGELYSAYWKNDPVRIVAVDSQGNRHAVSRKDLSDYRLYSIGLEANQLSEPVQIKSQGVWKPLELAKDYRTYPKVGGDQLEIKSEFLAWRSSVGKEAFPRRPETRDGDEFRYALNQTVIILANERLRDRVLKVVLLSTNSPTFRRFLVHSEQSADWVPAPANSIKWLLHPGMNELLARVETRHGWKGPVSSLRMFYKPPLFESLPFSRSNVLTATWHRAGDPPIQTPQSGS